ncbi:uncharacterized protein LOC109714866 isoform X3 [Ananas comosus]|uniref:Epidermal patterning factor-like protein n=1 Tax=Ananas comosus TaxID=4615 RepID=A0A6P5FQ38_ANACO|nr:uncharacterized protein LOC109714866 isoform X3 [Ananas comosus]
MLDLVSSSPSFPTADVPKKTPNIRFSLFPWMPSSYLLPHLRSTWWPSVPCRVQYPPTIHSNFLDALPVVSIVRWLSIGLKTASRSFTSPLVRCWEDYWKLSPRGSPSATDHRRAGATRWENKEEWHDAEKSRRVHGKADTVQVIAGSRLPDCSHACGSCSPCRLVMVSFVCASLQEAETCPMAYKCMCNSKSYPVP